jgi:hypothetical protein
MANVTNFEKLAETRRHELHHFIQVLNRRIVEGSYRSALVVSSITHTPWETGRASEAVRAVLAAFVADLRAITAVAGAEANDAVKALEMGPPAYEQKLATAKARAMQSSTGAVNHAFDGLLAAGQNYPGDQEIVLSLVTGVESVITSVLGFLMQMCTTLVERRERLANKGSDALLVFVGNAFEAHSKWIETMLPREVLSANG